MDNIIKKTMRLTASMVTVIFGFNMILAPVGYAQVAFLPEVGSMVTLTPKFDPMLVKGVKLYPDNPFKFDFIVDTGDVNLSEDQIKNQGQKLISYFLASLTTPEKEMWVNLSPYENNRIIPTAFGETEMGKEILTQDYMLKQIMATALYPERQLGREFWAKVYDQAAKKFGTTNVPVNTFNKVWILPDQATVYENSRMNTVFVVQSTLKVMLEQDYLAANKNKAVEQFGLTKTPQATAASAMSAQIIKEIVIPALENEVNTGKNFAALRQVYGSLILASWYKNNLKDNVLAKGYVNRNKTMGVDVADKDITQKIYKQYLQAYRKGVYNYIKEEVDPSTQQIIPRKYFSGGLTFEGFKPNSAMVTDPKVVAFDAAMAGRVSSLRTIAAGAEPAGNADLLKAFQQQQTAGAVQKDREDVKRLRAQRALDEENRINALRQEQVDFINTQEALHFKELSKSYSTQAARVIAGNRAKADAIIKFGFNGSNQVVTLFSDSQRLKQLSDSKLTEAYQEDLTAQARDVYQYFLQDPKTVSAYFSNYLAYIGAIHQQMREMIVAAGQTVPATAAANSYVKLASTIAADPILGDAILSEMRNMRLKNDLGDRLDAASKLQEMLREIDLPVDLSALFGNRSFVLSTTADVPELVSTIESLKASEQRMVSSLKENRAKRSALQAELNRIRSNYQAFVQHRTEGIDERYMQAYARIIENEARIQAAIRDLQALEATLSVQENNEQQRANVQSRIAQLTQNIADLKRTAKSYRDILSPKNKMSAQENEMLEAALPGIRQELDAVNAEIQTKGAELVQLQAQLADFVTRGIGSTKNYETANRIGGLRFKLDGLRADQQRFDAEFSADLTALDREFEETNINIAQERTLINELTTARDLIDQRANLTAQAKAQVRAVGDDLINLQGDLNLAQKMHSTAVAELDTAKANLDAFLTGGRESFVNSNITIAQGDAEAARQLHESAVADFTQAQADLVALQQSINGDQKHRNAFKAEERKYVELAKGKDERRRLVEEFWAKKNIVLKETAAQAIKQRRQAVAQAKAVLDAEEEHLASVRETETQLQQILLERLHMQKVSEEQSAHEMLEAEQKRFQAIEQAAHVLIQAHKAVADFTGKPGADLTSSEYATLEQQVVAAQQVFERVQSDQPPVAEEVVAIAEHLSTATPVQTVQIPAQYQRSQEEINFFNQLYHQIDVLTSLINEVSSPVLRLSQQGEEGQQFLALIQQWKTHFDTQLPNIINAETGLDAARKAAANPFSDEAKRVAIPNLQAVYENYTILKSYWDGERAVMDQLEGLLTSWLVRLHQQPAVANPVSSVPTPVISNPVVPVVSSPVVPVGRPIVQPPEVKPPVAPVETPKGGFRTVMQKLNPFKWGSSLKGLISRENRAKTTMMALLALAGAAVPSIGIDRGRQEDDSLKAFREAEAQIARDKARREEEARIAQAARTMTPAEKAAAIAAAMQETEGELANRTMAETAAVQAAEQARLAALAALAVQPVEPGTVGAAQIRPTQVAPVRVAGVVAHGAIKFSPIKPRSVAISPDIKKLARNWPQTATTIVTANLTGQQASDYILSRPVGEKVTVTVLNPNGLSGPELGSMLGASGASWVLANVRADGRKPVTFQVSSGDWKRMRQAAGNVVLPSTVTVVAKLSSTNLAANGGIDLEKVNVNAKRDGLGVKTAFNDPAVLEMLMKAQGLKPIIYNVAPVTLPMMNMLLGLNTSPAANDNNAPAKQADGKSPYLKAALFDLRHMNALV